MKKIILNFVISAAIILTGMFLSILIFKNADQTTQQDYYTVKEYQGKVAVFEKDSENPMDVLDVYVAQLPETDRTQLHDGIIIETKEKLARLIEDYDG